MIGMIVRQAVANSLLLLVAFAQTHVGARQATGITVAQPRRVGASVAGAPFSGELIVEDSSRKIYRALVFRDSEGKTRVDGLAGHASIAEISDPASGVSDILDIQNHVAHRVALEGLTFIMAGGCCPEKAIAIQSTERFLLNSTGRAMPAALGGPGARGDGGDVGGPGMIDGLAAEGYSQILTVPPGGVQLNFEPIIVRIESWYSATLKVTLLYKISDSRDGETSIRVINIKAGEPDRSLFQIPADYRTIEETSAFNINSAP